MKRFIALLLCAVLSPCLPFSCRAAESDATQRLMLWQDAAPYTEESPEQGQPFLTAFDVGESDIAIIICPGGGYSILSTREGAPVAEYMHDHGISAFVLTYRLSPCNPMAPLTDAQRAVRMVRLLGYRKVGIMGFSAGGHLAACAAVHWDAGDALAADRAERLSCRPDFFVCCYAVVSFASYTKQGSVSNLLGEQASDPRLLDFFSPERHVDANTPPAFIWHCAPDSLVPAGHSLLLAEALDKAGVTYDLHIYPDGKHGISLAKKTTFARYWPRECVRFIKSICGEEAKKAVEEAYSN